MLLIAILLPALAMAREAARRVQCMSNLRQTGLLQALYASDSEYWVPYTYMSNRVLRPTYITVEAAKKLWECPTAPPGDDYQWSSFRLTYAVAFEGRKCASGVGGPPDPFLYLYQTSRVDEIVTPSATGSMTDAHSKWYFTGPTATSPMDQFVSYRHSGGTNILYCDGHVSASPEDETDWRIFLKDKTAP